MLLHTGPGRGAAGQRFLGLPANINVYVTDPKREVSVSPHSDAQNVLVFQCCGMKRWKVWTPPPREARPAETFARRRNFLFPPAQVEAGGDAAPQSSGDEDAAEHGAVDVD